MASASKEEVIGKLNVRVLRGNNLIIADPLTHTSDPYVILQYGAQVHSPAPLFLRRLAPFLLRSIHCLLDPPVVDRARAPSAVPPADGAPFAAGPMGIGVGTVDLPRWRDLLVLGARLCLSV